MRRALNQDGGMKEPVEMPGRSPGLASQISD